MSRPEIKRLAHAMRRHSDRAAARRGAGRYRGIVIDPDPLTLDVVGLDYNLDEDDVTIGATVQREIDAVGGLQEGDVLILTELSSDEDDDDDYVAVDLLPRDED